MRFNDSVTNAGDYGSEAVRVDTGLAELVPDPDVPGAFTLVLDGMPQSHVNPGDPTMIAFDYVRRVVDVIDAVAPAGPLRFLHLGGGALTLPRCLAALRPGSEQRVVEVDAALLRLVLTRIPLDDPETTVVVGDALDAVREAPARSYDVIVADVFTGARIPQQVMTVEFARLAARALDRGGCYIANIIDRPGLSLVRRLAGTLADVFDGVAVIAEAEVLRGKAGGNLLLVAGDGSLPIASLVRRATADPSVLRVEHGARLAAFIKGGSR